MGKGRNRGRVGDGWGRVGVVGKVGECQERVGKVKNWWELIGKGGEG